MTGIHCLSLATADLERHAAIMSAVLGGDGEPIQDDQLKARGVRFEVGSHILEYLTPNESSSPVATHLASNAPVPYRVSLTQGELLRQGLNSGSLRSGSVPKVNRALRMKIVAAVTP